jgi:DMSO/TMAO reductase YedYZ heme-binding membrane subunit
MQKSSILFLWLGILLAGVGAYLSFFSSTPGTLFIRFFGLAALIFTSITLMIGPLVVISPARFAPLVEPRRAIGLTAFIFMMIHFMLVLLHVYGGDWSLSLESLNTLIAVPALFFFTLMAVTSSDFAIKKMGAKNWKKVQQLNYLAFILIIGHFLLSQGGPFTILVDQRVFVNVAELLVWVFVWAAILLQLVGFFIKRKKMRAAATSSPPIQT